MIDIAVILTIHDESIVTGPTIRSAQIAIEEAKKAGYSVELLIGFDTPSQAALDYFSRDMFSNWQKHFFEFRDQGLARSALVEASSARWIAFLDADDLFSSNWLVEAAGVLKQAEVDGRRVIAHPEINWIFDGAATAIVNIGQDDPLFHPYQNYFFNYYDALCMTPRQAHLEHPYCLRDMPNGFAYEDWQWSIETMAGGWVHLIANDTIIFKRRRDMSQTIRAASRVVTYRELDVMRIDQVYGLGRDLA